MTTSTFQFVPVSPEAVQAAKENQPAKLHPCDDCGAEISRKAASCPHCGRPSDNTRPGEVRVADLSIGFVSLVALMIKVTFAAIPAAIIVAIIWIATIGTISDLMR